MIGGSFSIWRPTCSGSCRSHRKLNRQTPCHQESMPGVVLTTTSCPLYTFKQRKQKTLPWRYCTPYCRRVRTRRARRNTSSAALRKHIDNVSSRLYERTPHQDASASLTNWVGLSASSGSWRQTMGQSGSTSTAPFRRRRRSLVREAGLRPVSGTVEISHKASLQGG